MTLTQRYYEGTPGNRQHITLVEKGTIPPQALAGYHGVKGEVRHAHANRQGAAWDGFLADVRANGVREPIFVTVDPHRAPEISEGNHRLDAALEAGRSSIPVEIRYYGHAEREGTVLERAGQRRRRHRHRYSANLPRRPMWCGRPR